jgi:DNA-binding MarR family transcriptional regulator
LISEALSTMDHVEVLFRVHRRVDATADWLATDAHVDPGVLARVLRDLEAANLVVEQNGSYRVTDAPRNRAAVEQVAAMYNARPVTLVRAVYARVSPVTTFADAFRLRRKE